ncbi:hypothetical protein BGZ83_001043 [Gryganskiella cystojenkinii]|nr:hypothetical protein BGZ83_001043 [Gryganskiella cystojenkinii]
MTDHPPNDDQHHQTFRDQDGSLIRIPVAPSKTTEDNYVIWTDIEDCFPNVLRIQHDDIFVPKLRDENLYRVTPHGIKYHPGVILNVIYKDQHTLPVPSIGDQDNIAIVTDTMVEPKSRSTHESNGHQLRSQDHSIGSSSPNASNIVTKSKRPEPPRPLPQQLEEQKPTSATTLVAPMTSLPDTAASRPGTPKITIYPENVSEPENLSKSSFESRPSTSPSSSSSSSRGPSPHPTEGSSSVQDQEGDQETEDGQEDELGSDEEESFESEEDEEDEEEEGDYFEGNETESISGDESHDSDEQLEQEEFAGEVWIPPLEHRIFPIAPTHPSGKPLSRDEEWLLRQANLLSNTNKPGLAPSLHTNNQQLDQDLLHLLEIIGHRMRKVLDRRYRWAESLMPKFFIPVLRDQKSLSKIDISSGTVLLRPEDFAIQFCCDCGEISGNHDLAQTWHPHWRLDSTQRSYTIRPRHELELFDIYGDYMMGALELLLYGAYLDKDRRIQAYSSDPLVLQNLTISISFLSSQGIRTSKEILDETRPLPSAQRLKTIPMIRTLGGKEDFNQLLKFIGATRPLKNFFPFITPDRDVRWLCLIHQEQLRVKRSRDPMGLANFRTHRDSQDSGYNANLASYRIRVKSAIQARLFYKLMPDLETVVNRFYLDWDMSADDIRELAGAISRTRVVAVTVEMRLPEKYKTPITSFEKGELGQLLIAALQNKNIELFVLEAINPDYPPKNLYDELSILALVDSMTATASFTRDVRSGRIALSAKVASVDASMTLLRKTVKGFHHLSKLHLEVDSVWDYVVVTFAEPEEVLKIPGAQVEDTEYQNEGRLAQFFNKRGLVDRVEYACYSLGDNLFLESGILTEIHILFSLTKDRERVRKMIRDNKNLKKLRFENKAMDDPSQIYESFKSLMVNHATLELMEVRQRQPKGTLGASSGGNISEYEWRNFQDTQSLEVSIQAFKNDKIGPMLQKYATSITWLSFNGLSDAMANILERSFRPKKGPFKLRKLWVHNPYLCDLGALEILGKFVMRAAIDEVWVLGDIPLSVSRTGNHISNNNNNSGGGGKDIKGKKTTSGLPVSSTLASMVMPPYMVYANFIVGIRSRITALRVWGKAVDKLMDSLSQSPDAFELPMLTALGLHEDEERKVPDPILEYKWLLALLKYKTPTDERPLWENGYPILDQEGRMLYLDSTMSSSTEFIKDERLDKDNFKTIAKPQGKPLSLPIKYQYEKIGMQPLTSITLKGIFVRDQDWPVLLQLLDWSVIEDFKISPRNPLGPKVLRDAFLKFIQVENPNSIADGTSGIGNSASTNGNLSAPTTTNSTATSSSTTNTVPAITLPPSTSRMRTFVLEADGPTNAEIQSCLEELEDRFLRVQESSTVLHSRNLQQKYNRMIHQQVQLMEILKQSLATDSKHGKEGAQEQHQQMEQFLENVRMKRRLQFPFLSHSTAVAVEGSTGLPKTATGEQDTKASDLQVDASTSSSLALAPVSSTAETTMTAPSLSSEVTTGSSVASKNATKVKLESPQQKQGQKTEWTPIPVKNWTLNDFQSVHESQVQLQQDLKVTRTKQKIVQEKEWFDRRHKLYAEDPEKNASLKRCHYYRTMNDKDERTVVMINGYVTATFQ